LRFKIEVIPLAALTVREPALVPSVPPLFTVSVPFVTAVPPVYEFAPLNTVNPPPVLVIPMPDPLMTELIVSVDPVSTSKFPLDAKAKFRTPDPELPFGP
jgi:hypothetical protein